MENDTKIGLLMRSLTEFYKNEEHINEIKDIINQQSVLSLRILDWFVTNYSKKNNTSIIVNNRLFNIYNNYKLLLKSYSKSFLDVFNRKNKLAFYYNDDNFIETSCGQLCFFRWCIQNGILKYVKDNLDTIEEDMKCSLKNSKKEKTLNKEPTKKRKQLSTKQNKCMSFHNIKYKINFE